MMTHWLVGPHGRNSSGPYTQNFLWQSGDVFVMDNHRAAMWCWLHRINPDARYSLLHIDRHYDTLSSQLEAWLKLCPDVSNMTVEEYLGVLGADYGGVRPPLFRFDNFLSLFLAKHGGSLDRAIFATHQEGDRPDHAELDQVVTWKLPGFLEYELEHEGPPWIVDLDLDYFFYDTGEGDYRLLFDREYRTHVLRLLRQFLETGRVAVMTIALSPEFCGGWPPAERIMSEVSEALALNFALPASSV